MIYFINNCCYFYFFFIKKIIYYFIYLIFLSRILKLVLFPSESLHKYFFLDTFRFLKKIYMIYLYNHMFFFLIYQIKKYLFI